MADQLKPGTVAPFSGIIEDVRPNGTSTGHQVTVIKGHPIPPTQKKRDQFKKVIVTNAGRKK